MPENNSLFAKQIKNEARRLGFGDCGISRAEFLPEEAVCLEKWLRSKKNGTMNYMANNFDKRLDPSKLVENARSVISLIHNYRPKVSQPQNTFQIAKFAHGEDYHKVLKDKMFALLKWINENIKICNGRVFVDSAPVLDRAWAKRSGLGWIGKSTNLITPEFGSYVFISEIIIDIELAYDLPNEENCGACSRCIDACPTGAIVEPYVVDARKCNSFITIENSEEITESQSQKLGNNIFGCDICLDVCPHNKITPPTLETRFQPTDNLFGMTKENWINLSPETFNVLFKKTPVRRVKYAGLMRNIQTIAKTTPT